VKPNNLIIGCNGRGAQESSLDRPVSIDEPPLDDQFRYGEGFRRL